MAWILAGLSCLAPRASASEPARWARENEAAVASFRTAGQPDSPAAPTTPWKP